MKKNFLFGAWVLLVGVACSNEEAVTQVPPAEGNLSVELKLAEPSDAVTRVGSYWATEAERTVKTLDAYLFAPADKEGEYVLEKKYAGLLGEEWTPADPESTKPVSLPNVTRTAKKILFVANGGGVTALNGVNAGIGESAFRALLMNTLTANPAVDADHPLVMTAEATLDASVWQDAPLAVSAGTVALQRVVARVDLVVKAQKDATFVPTRLAMENARSRSYIFPWGGNYAEGGADLLLERTIDAAQGVTVEGGTAYRSLLFPYEAPAADPMKLVVEGNLTVGEKTVKASFDIPFADEKGERLPVERNTCYTVTVMKISGLTATVNVTFTVAEWVVVDEIECPVWVENFTVTGDGLNGNQLSIGAAAGDSKVLTVATNVAWTAEVTQGDDFLTATAADGSLTLTTASANESGQPRKALVVLSTAADPHVSYTLVVTQVAN